MKRLLMAVALAGLVGFSGIQMASAYGGGHGPRGGYGPDGGAGYCGQYDEADNSKDGAAEEKFKTDTQALRRSIIVKRSELRALMNQTNPDEKRVAQLTGEVFDLEAELGKKAKEAGLTGRSSYGRGPDMRRDYGYRNGGRHMRDW